MKFGMFVVPFAMPYANGQRSAAEVIEWDLQLAKWSDQYGLDEVFFAEHYTVGSEPSPAPDLMIAAAAQLTKTITLGAAAHVLPYHNPVSLAHRMLWLDHMTGGRYIAGAAPGVYPIDAQLFGTGKNNPEMMIEALDIIEAIWTKPGPFTIEGKYWTADMPAYDKDMHGPHLKPFQSPHPRIAMTGMQAKSPTLELAGSRGYIPMSQQVCAGALNSHWETYTTAADKAGHAYDRSDWRIMRDFFVADTDEEARDAVINGMAGQTWREYLLPTFAEINLLNLVAGDDVDPADVDVEWMTDNFWLVGSPETVAEKVRALDEQVGGVGSIVSFTYDYFDDPEPYRRSIELMGTKVAALVNGAS
jgi:alkanesulfonate monooxygenase SsuD/methylene tetrahydromethanopterin reductase-like flavin-dependent oxidoreductase (luciferase family)